MKKYLLLLSFSFLLFSCGKNERKGVEKAVVPCVTVMVYDISFSTDAFAILQQDYFKPIYYGTGYNGGGKFYGLFIKANSRKQDPFSFSIPSLDTMPVQGNAYQQQNRRNKNAEIVGKFEQGEGAFTNAAASKMIVAKNEGYSDIQSALELAKVILSNPMYSGWHKNLLIISDMQHNVPGGSYIDPMKAVKFDGDVKIAVVRASAEVNVAQLLGGSNYAPYSTIPDAINSMFNY